MALGTEESDLFERMQTTGSLVEGEDGYVGIGEDHIAIFNDDGAEIVYWTAREFEEGTNDSAAPATIRAIMMTMQKGASAVEEELYS
jgi:hypothetical protein